MDTFNYDLNNIFNEKIEILNNNIKLLNNYSINNYKYNEIKIFINYITLLIDKIDEANDILQNIQNIKINNYINEKIDDEVMMNILPLILMLKLSINQKYNNIEDND
jgi:hypothetical protein